MHTSCIYSTWQLHVDHLQVVFIDTVDRINMDLHALITFMLVTHSAHTRTCVHTHTHTRHLTLEVCQWEGRKEVEKCRGQCWSCSTSWMTSALTVTLLKWVVALNQHTQCHYINCLCYIAYLVFSGNSCYQPWEWTLWTQHFLDQVMLTIYVYCIRRESRTQGSRLLFLLLGCRDHKIELPLPNEETRAHILRIRSRKMNVSQDVNFEELARWLQWCPVEGCLCGGWHDSSKEKGNWAHPWGLCGR